MTFQVPNLAAPPLRVAIIHEWLVVYGGSESVVRELLRMYPDADLFALVDYLSDEDRSKLQGKHAKTSFIQRLPFSKNKYRAYLPFMPLAIEQFDLSNYDLVISSSHATAKGVITGPDQRHVCYCHSPVRYAWDLQHQYLRQGNLTSGLKSVFARIILHYIRMWDTRTANGVDLFIANSAYIARRIRKVYGRSASVVYPPVDTDAFPLQNVKENFYLAASRMVPYKRIDLIVEAFAGMPEKRLIVIGDGSEMPKIRKLATSNISLLGYQSNTVLRDHLQRARAFVFAAEEDFGILPVEAQACGTPVIAFAKGGAIETVLEPRNKRLEPPTGIFFESQTPQSVRDAIANFERADCPFAPEACRANAEKYSIENFHQKFRQLVEDNWAQKA